MHELLISPTLGRRLRSLLLFLLPALGLCPAPGSAQEVRGRLVSIEGTAIPWALVHLVNASDEEVITVVSSSSGAFTLRAANPGTYRVKAERIGYAATFSEPLSLTRDEPRTVVLTAVDSPIALPALEVETEASCDLGHRAGPTLLAVWTEVRKALELQTRTDQSGDYEFEGEQYNYLVDRQGRPVDEELAEQQTEKVRFSGSSGFYAIDPEVLAERGFRVITTEGDRVYYAPDAMTLLSEPFQATHCYSVRRDGNRLGLSFEPLRTRADRDKDDYTVDVDGTLWLDEKTGELQAIEFDYVSDGIPGHDLEGGYLEFERLPEGAWIVRRWWLREPVYSRRNRQISSLLEAGARITSVRKRSRMPEPAPDRVAPNPELLGRSREPAGQTEVALPAAPRGLADVERARQLFSEDRPAEASAALRTACATGDSVALAAIWADFRGLATSAELGEWDARPVTRRCAFLGDMIAERAMRAGVSVEARLAQHYERLARARTEWGLDRPRVQTGAAELYGRHPDLEYDDRGLVYVRVGEPDEISYAIATGQEDAMGNRIEGWRYDRPGGPRVFFFAPVTQLGIDLRDFRLLDAPWRALGTWNAGTELEVIQGGISAREVSRLYLSFEGLDPVYATRAHRLESFEREFEAANGGATEGLARGAGVVQELSEVREETLADVAFVVDSVPDAPALSPSVSFIWERLRFFNPASTETVILVPRFGASRRSSTWRGRGRRNRIQRATLRRRSAGHGRDDGFALHGGRDGWPTRG